MEGKTAQQKEIVLIMWIIQRPDTGFIGLNNLILAFSETIFMKGSVGFVSSCEDLSRSLHRQSRSKAMTSPTSCRSLGWARTTRACMNVESRTRTTESSRSTRLKPTWKSTPPSALATGPLRRARRCTWPIRNPARAARLPARTAWVQTRGPSPLLPLRRHTPKQSNTAQGQVRDFRRICCRV